MGQRLSALLFRWMWRLMHASGYFSKHPHYVDWMRGGGASLLDCGSPPIGSPFHQLDFSRNDIVFPGDYSDQLERAVKRYEEYWLPKMFDLPATGRAVDLGCGFGRSVEWLQHRYSRVVGVDISQRLLQQARQRFRESPHVEFLLGDGLNLPISDESVDFIYSFTVFQHIPRPFVENYLREFRRTLRPGGSAVFNILSGVNESKRLGMPFREWSIGYDPSEIQRLAKMAGLRTAKQVKWRLGGGTGHWAWFHLKQP